MGGACACVRARGSLEGSASAHAVAQRLDGRAFRVRQSGNENRARACPAGHTPRPPAQQRVSVDSGQRWGAGGRGKGKGGKRVRVQAPPGARGLLAVGAGPGVGRGLLAEVLHAAAPPEGRNPRSP